MLQGVTVVLVARRENLLEELKGKSFFSLDTNNNFLPGKIVAAGGKAYFRKADITDKEQVGWKCDYLFG
jgi:hypothetical protein